MSIFNIASVSHFTIGQRSWSRRKTFSVKSCFTEKWIRPDWWHRQRGKDPLVLSGSLDLDSDIISLCSPDMQGRLPASFTSLYRLFLRTASASVLHHKTARLNLITRWRPIFNAAAKVTKELEYSNPQDSSSSNSTWRQERIDWLKIWNERGRFFFVLILFSKPESKIPKPHLLS